MGRRVALQDSDGEGSFEPFYRDSAPAKKRRPEFRRADAFPAGPNPRFGNFCEGWFASIG